MDSRMDMESLSPMQTKSLKEFGGMESFKIDQ